jgi:hypothetical protein
MKGSTLLSLFCITAAATPLTGGRPNLPTRDIPNYPGLRFDSNGKLSISIFSDLHFGERELHLNWFRGPVWLTVSSLKRGEGLQNNIGDELGPR